MQNTRIFKAFFLILILTTRLFAAGPKIGTYIGFVTFEGRTEKVGLCIEFERRDTVDGKSQLIAFLKLKLGGFTTHEYVSHYYVVEDYLWDSSEIVLDGMLSGFGTDLTFWQGMVLDDGNKITGKIRSTRGGVIRGHAELVYTPTPDDFEKVNAIFPNIPMVKSLTGEYKGRCEGKDITLQLEASKLEDSSRDKINTLQGVQIRARTLGYSRFSTLAGNSTIFGTWLGASYNPYSAVLLLPAAEESCHVKGDSIKCGNRCEFTRLASAPDSLDEYMVKYKCSKKSREHHLKGIEQIENHIFPTKDRSNIEGEYYGVLHLEERNIYKIMSLEIALSGAPVENSDHRSWQKMVSMVGRIFPSTDHGTDTDTDSSISIAFVPTQLALGKFKELLLDSTGDQILKITEWGEQGLKGILYSKSYGKVGTVEFVKGENPDVAIFNGVHLPKPVQGKYTANISRPNNSCFSMDFNLTMMAISNSNNHVPSYFPFTLTGTAELYCGSSTVYGVVQSGIVDFYTGTILLSLDADQTILGKITDYGIEGALLGGYTGTAGRLQRVIKFKRY